MDSSSTVSAPEGPLISVAALHALAYCERLFYLEEVERIRVADAAVFAGRRLHVELAKDDAEGSCVVGRVKAREFGPEAGQRFFGFAGAFARSSA